MSPEFANAIDPIILDVLALKKSVDAGVIDFGEVDQARNRIIARIDSLQSKIGDSASRRSSQMALCAWIDSLFIEDTNWEWRQYWRNHCLEVEFFQVRKSHVDFFKWARDASGIGNKDALEVFYLAVVLGYRGLYKGDMPGDDSRREELSLPPEIDQWCRSTAASIQLKQSRPKPRPVIQSAGSFEPLRGRSQLAQYSVMGIVLCAAAVGVAIFYYKLLEGY